MRRRTRGWASLVTVAVAATALVEPASGGSVEGGADEGVREVVFFEGRASFLLAPDEVVQGRATPAGFLLDVRRGGGLPKPSGLPQAPEPPGTPAAFADCLNDVPQSGAHVAKNANPLTPNHASEGACEAETHQGPVHFLQFRTSGNRQGVLHLWGSNGWLLIRCSTFHVVGAGASGVWTPPPAPPSACSASADGATPDQFSSWTAAVVNEHDSGNTYALLVGLPTHETNAER